MKRLAIVGMLTVAGAMVSSTVWAQEAGKKIPLAEARAQIGVAIKNPATLTEVMKGLAPEDQTAFLGDVNVAIAKSPDSAEGRVAAALNANRAALRGAAKGNLPALLAETFATATPEALTVINERFAKDVFNRANEKRTFTDEQFTRIAQGTMAKIQDRTASADNAAVRNVFAILMFVRASNGTPADLAETLLAGLPEGSPVAKARQDWIPSALGIGCPKTYEPMLGYAEVGIEPKDEVVFTIAGPQVLSAMLFDLATGLTDKEGNAAFPFSEAALQINDSQNVGRDVHLSRIPRTLDKSLPWNPSNGRGESHGYQWQEP